MHLEHVRTMIVEQGNIIIQMDYIGGEFLSVNHYKYKGRYTKRETRKWMGELSAAVRLMMMAHNLEFKPPLQIGVACCFKDKRSSCDPDNLLKVIGDSIKEATFVDDKDYNWYTEKLIGCSEPHITIAISQGG